MSLLKNIQGEISDKKYELICNTLEIFQNINENFNFSSEKNWEHVDIEPHRELFLYLLKTKDRKLINHMRLFTGIFPGYKADTESLEFSEFIKNKDLNLKERFKVDSNGIAYLTHHKYNFNIIDNYIKHVLPKSFKYSIPDILGEIGYHKNGLIYNWNVFSGLERIALMNESGCYDYLQNRQNNRISSDGLNIFEIGAGYGFLANLLMQGLKVKKYIIVDIPESMLFSSLYLIVAQEKEVIVVPDIRKEKFEKDAIYIIPHFFADKISEYFPQIDLVLNTLSFHEMHSADVINYADQIKNIFEKQSEPGIIFEQNFENLNFKKDGGSNAKELLREKFISHKVKTHTHQTRGWPEIHTLNKNTLDEIIKLRPNIGIINKFRWLFLSTRIKFGRVMNPKIKLLLKKIL